jgi:hypothetical protein
MWAAADLLGFDMRGTAAASSSGARTRPDRGRAVKPSVLVGFGVGGLRGLVLSFGWCCCLLGLFGGWGRLGACFVVGFGLGWLVGSWAECPLRFGRLWGVGIPWGLRLPLGVSCCLGSGGGGSFCLLLCLCILGSPPPGGLCWLGFCLLGGPWGGERLRGSLSLSSIFGCRGGARPRCGSCLFFRRWSTILFTGVWWGSTCGEGLSGCAKAASVASWAWFDRPRVRLT